MLVLTTACSVLTGRQAADAPERLDLRFLLLGSSAQTPGLEAWRAALHSQGVPFDVVLAGDDEPLTAERLRVGGQHGRYQAVVQASDAGGPVDLAPAERAALDDYVRTFGVREVIACGAPPTAASAPLQDLAGTRLTLTPQGSPWFPYLAGGVPVTVGRGWLPTSAGSDAEALLSGPGGQPVVAQVRSRGYDQLYVGVQTAPWMTHAQLLAPGLIGWATRGVHLGNHRFYLAAQVDDVLLPNYLWDPQRNETVFDDRRVVRMTPDDVRYAVEWSRRQGFTLDLAYNGGATYDADLWQALRDARHDFRWVNHTYSHVNLNHVSEQDALDQIQRNIKWAELNDIPLSNVHELVTGEHTGLDNPALVPALEKADIRFIASDASRRRDPYRLGPATTVPRHPVNIYYNVATREQQLDAYNHAYHETCKGEFCLKAPLTWEQYVEQMVRDLLTATLSNDPRTTYVHQSNLAGDRNLLAVLDATLARYRELVTAPLVQPTLTESGEALLAQQAWAQALGDRAVEAYLENGSLVLRAATRDLNVPVTGAGDETYAGERSGWLSVPAGAERRVPVTPR